MSSNDEADDPFGAIKFGEFRKYMQNKKSKLKRQEKEVQDQASQKLPQIFSGTSIYINGYTSPPSNELRRLILQHGGDYQHYLKKLSVTHIIATNLTNSKVDEFRSYKVVKPTWITESIAAGKLLPWQNYRLVLTASKQKELVVSRTPTKPTGESLNAQILASDRTREMSTANPEFLDRFYKSSRLHYLSTWKSELKDIVERLEESGVKKPGINIKKRKKDMPRIVMHVDFDCFFASVGIRDRPHLIDKPVAVSHSTSPTENSSSDIASCNYVARSFGLKNGMSIGRAKGLCPDLQVITYEFDKYKEVSTKFYEILFSYADKMQAISVDEALLEVGSSIDVDQVESLATTIRNEIKDSTGCDASIGIGPNILLARMSTRKAKPAGQYYCKTQDDIDSLLDGQSVNHLPGVGYAISEKLKDMKVEAVSDLRNVPLHELQSKIGSKLGKTLYEFSRGIDNQPLVTHQKRASVSAEVNWGVRFANEENEREFVLNLSKEISERLLKHKVKGKSITLKFLKRKEDAEEASKHLGHGIVDSYSKSTALNDYTDDPAIINKHAYSLLKSFGVSYADIRGLGIHISKLDNQDTLSPDQGKLDFTTHAKSPDSVTKPTASTSASKSNLVVDMEIYNQLPPAVQKDLASEFEISYQEPTEPPKERETIVKEQKEKEIIVKESNIDISSSMVSQLPELPPWSQLDPSALLALPDKMREQVLKAYEEKNQSKKQAVNVTPPTTPTNTNRPRTPIHSPSATGKLSPSSTGKLSPSSTGKHSPSSTGKRSPRSRKDPNTPSITEMFQKAGSPPRTPSTRNFRVKRMFDHGDVDTQVWNELPEFVRVDLIDDQQKANDAQDPDEDPQEIEQIVDLEYIEEPSLQGVTDIDELRKLLKDWLFSFEAAPQDQDISIVSTYLIDLVEDSQFEKVQLLLAYLNYVIMSFPEPSGQRETVLHIRNTVDEYMIEMCGYTLKIR